MTDTHPILPFLLSHLSRPSSPRPFFLGLSGPQGSGKSTLVASLAASLRAAPHSLRVAVLSIDDLYLPHSSQLALAASQPSNALVAHRGQPGTHDVALGAAVFAALKAGDGEVQLPRYDKAAFGGAGDREPVQRWEAVRGGVDVVLFEGWCVGFRALGAERVGEVWRASSGTVARNALADVKFVDASLEAYDVLTDQLDALVHIDAEDIGYVYAWRQQQEAALRAERGMGMTVEQVTAFVDGYMPGYELYVDELRRGAMKEPGKQLRVVVGREREIVSVTEI
ncbi:putative Uridine/cytidine kinase [Geopyxis carbonaria]|nr:putative Uridine/cytidine kinase [Geopyxis carbonaria]